MIVCYVSLKVEIKLFVYGNNLTFDDAANKYCDLSNIFLKTVVIRTQECA